IEAVPPAERAVTLYRQLATDKPTYKPNLAGALVNLGACYSGVGRRIEAVPPAERAVTLYRQLAAEYPAYQPDLAGTLTNLGTCYSGVGRRTDAVPPAEEAVTLYRELAAENPAYQPNFAMALNSLGIRYSEVGRLTEAVQTADEAVTLYRELAAENPGYQPNLAGALTNLAACYSEVDRRTEAVPPGEEAVTLYRQLATENPAYQPNLAGALNNLGNCYSEVGRRTDAVPPAEEAVAIRRELAVENPAYQPNLAMALNNLGIRYSEVDRLTDAVPPTEEAVTLYRQLAPQNPAHLPGLAMALNNLGIRYGEIDRLPEAVPPAEEAVTLYQQLATENPSRLPDLASGLNNLMLRLSQVNRDDQADVVWQEVIESQAGFGQMYLLLSRACSVPEGDLRAVCWLVRAEIEGAADPASAAAIHDCAREHRRADPETWDRHWSTASAAPLPAWLLVDPELLEVASAWVATSTYYAEHTYLLEHPELLTDSCDVAVEEALLDTADSDRYIQLRATAHEHGITAAYEPVFRALTLQQFLAAEPQQQRDLLTEHPHRLLHDDTWQQLNDLIDADPDDPRPLRAAALIDLAAHDTGTATLPDTFDALDDPTLFPALLAAAARSNTASYLLGPVAQLAYLCAETVERAADATVYMACAFVITSDPGNTDASEHLQHAIGLAPHRRADWITLLADLATVHPTLVSLIPLLAKESTDVQE
ncbi:tetratricopeptide repeat protein, partial [Nocardia sp. NPDC057663]|uniref:tetratricopeptide repeat protein n=1 Tax=Nocardia sp. NPDC057663 TaxID=3346201 RepID=UPI00366C7C3A